jgi:surfactin synthase thioesterase subunit
MHSPRAAPPPPIRVRSTGPSTRRPLKLFCFHHAGGSTASFTGWQRALGPHAEVVAVALPGRSSTDPEQRYDSITALAEALRHGLGDQLEEPHLFYGHSMGALLAYHITRLRVSSGLPPPLRLLVSAFPAPHLPHLLSQVQQLADEQLTQWLLDLTGMPQTLLAGRRRRERQVALLREDLQVCASHRPEEATAPLPCPIDTFVGAQDPLVAVHDAAAWSRHSGPGHTFRVLPGGHFFPRESKTAFFQELARVIASAQPPGLRASWASTPRRTT